MLDLQIIAGLSWDPALKGILAVLVGVVVLMGSVYLLVATNTGARLGLLIALGGLFGWLSILTLYWWIIPPAIGPTGQPPSWKPVEIYVNEPGAGPAKTPALNNLPPPAALPTATEVIEQHPDIAAELVTKPENTTLSDIAGVPGGKDVLVNDYGLSKDGELDGWRLLSTADAGEAQAAADQALAEAELFTDATAYKKLNAFETGGAPKREDDCPGAEEGAEGTHNLIPDDAACRALARIKKTFRLWHDPQYVVVQVQPVIAQEAQPGQPPPTPTLDPEQPVISVVLLRDEGSVRAKPAYFFAICFSLFVVFVLLLHYRDKTLQKNLKAAEAAAADAKAQKG